MIATFLAPAAGTYTVRLTVGNGATTDSKDVVITVDDTFPDLFGLRFAHVKNVLENIRHDGTTTCTSCHTSPAVSPTPPMFYNNFDRNGNGGVADATDEEDAFMTNLDLDPAAGRARPIRRCRVLGDEALEATALDGSPGACPVGLQPADR